MLSKAIKRPIQALNTDRSIYFRVQRAIQTASLCDVKIKAMCLAQSALSLRLVVDLIERPRLSCNATNAVLNASELIACVFANSSSCLLLPFNSPPTQPIIHHVLVAKPPSLPGRREHRLLVRLPVHRRRNQLFRRVWCRKRDALRKYTTRFNNSV